MTGARRPALVPLLALTAGVVLLAVTLARTDLRSLAALSWQLGAALPLALVPGAAWHLLRTAAWQRCFPVDRPPRFARLFRVRLAAEAFSFVTIRGVAGEPLKVALLDDVPPAVSAAAVALERVAYIAVTVLAIGAAAALALATLPLSDPWTHVFRVLVWVSAALTLGLVALLLRPASAPAPADHAEPIARANRVWRRVARFAREVRLRWRELVQGDRRRFAVLLSLELAAYAMMALEVWVVLRAVHVPIAASGALAIETVTRVVSVLTAFIPGNVGALEASNVAAAAAVHATAGAAALAVVRRLRGLLWCAAGFAVAPRAGSRAVPADPPGQARASVPGAERSPGAHTLVVIDDARAGRDVPLTVRLGGLPLGERVVRAAAAAGYRRLLVWSPERPAAWTGALAHHGDSLVAVAADDTAALMAAAVAHAPADTYCVPRSPAALASAERALRASIVKPTDGPVARFNRRFSIPVSVWLIQRLRFSANAMSLFVLALGLYAGWLFARGDYVSGVLAAATSLVASVLDGCDGELARLQYRPSTFGCWLDTLGDYAYYLATFTGLTIGAVRQSGRVEYWWIGGTLLAGTLATCWLLIVLRHRATGGRPERLHVRAKAHFTAGPAWARLAAKLSNCATRATMPYGILAFAIVSLLPVVLVLGAIGAQIYWISLAVELRRLLPAPLPAVNRSASPA
jgi:phosphatidylglycerophosphate synthase